MVVLLSCISVAQMKMLYIKASFFMGNHSSSSNPSNNYQNVPEILRKYSYTK
jgi:hypothetical protein